MKKKLGKLTALYLCWELWNWLAENPDKGKYDWFHLDENKNRFQFNQQCFACEYANQHELPNCDNEKTSCIVPVFADVNCCYTHSPYRRWGVGNDRVESARIIANSAYKEYVRLGGKKTKQPNTVST